MKNPPSIRQLIVFLFVLICDAQSQFVEPHVEGESKPCYDRTGRPQKCGPELTNVAFNKRFEVTNTCGEDGPSEYCIQSSLNINRKSCQVCDARDPRFAHPPEYLTDLNNNDEPTYWQSGTMYEGVEWPNSVNLTLHLGKSFEIAFIDFKFQSPRPESMAIYKKTSDDGPWIPIQYYSASCRGFYGVPDMEYADKSDESRALCTKEQSEISPLEGGEILFKTLEGRPSYLYFENNKDLQEFLTATAIRISLDRHNTFGDELFSDPKVLKSYFYAIRDISISAFCKCNGHARYCVPSSGPSGDQRLVCQCEHNTAGADCDRCLPFYNDRPWKRATDADAHECKACNCNGFSDRCHFDQKQYETTGHGGHCDDCRGNRDGPNCERCKPNFYQRSDGYCIACNCDETGSRSSQCNSEGKCQCKPGIGGDKCDSCLPNYYDFSSQGCKPCSCSVPGSWGNQPNCDILTGLCSCKANVEGQQCDGCKPGYFNLDLENDFGCTPCFCYGHASVCTSAPGYGQILLESLFTRGSERWNAEEGYGRQVATQYNAVTQNIGVNALGRESVYFMAPDRFLGDQRGSYNQEFNFTLRIGEHSPKPSAEDIIIEGAGLKISRPIFGQRNPLPSIQNQEFSFRLHEHPDFGWNPKLTARDFISVLSNVTAIKIRGTYTTRGVGFLDNVKLKTARRLAAGSPAHWIEMCTCPDAYVGQFCESCAPGYTHEPKNGGPFARCVPCSCNGHAEICDPETGQCICQHNTAGDNCERCARGFYGNALKGNDSECKPCPCPNQGACIELNDDGKKQIVCLECPTGYAGPQCEFCADGYFGDPSGEFGELECKPCNCNGNIDLNAVGNCNRTTGECLKCIYNTFGPQCDQCAPGFYGDALKLPKGDCVPCECEPLGSIPGADNIYVCEQPTGQCQCKDNVIGRRCDECMDGFYDLGSNQGCQECSCNPIGSLSSSCHWNTGMCFCREGVVGFTCDKCAPNHFGFSPEGCKPCDCDPIGSRALMCNENGQCPCRDNVEGLRCERCKENTFNRQAGCIDCPACYNLVQEAVNEQREKLTAMEKLLEDIANTPTVIDDVDFERKLAQVQERVDQLWTDARSATGGEDKSLLEKVNELRDRIKALGGTSQQIRESLQRCSTNAADSQTNLTATENVIEGLQDVLKNAQRFLDTDGKEALEKAQEKSIEQGQQRTLMSELAKQARQLANDHEDEALKLEKIASAALNTSNEAHDIAWSSIQQQRNASDESRNLLHSVKQLEDDASVTKSKAENALEVAKEAYNNALNLFKDAYSLSLPTIDFNTIKEQAKRAKSEAETQAASLEKLLNDRESLLADADEESKKARELLNNAEKHQQIAEELLADLDRAKAAADKAKNKSDDTYREAQEIYNTLQNFTKNVEESQVAAEAASEKVPEIRTMIYESERETQANENELRGIKDAASRSMADADDAKQIAERASKEADSVRTECAETKSRANALQDEANELSQEVAKTEAKLAEAEEKVGEEDSLVRGALEKASEARSQSREAYEKVQRALNDIRDIEIALSNLDQINEEGLSTLESKISEVERELNAADLDSKIESLRAARNKQTLWIKNYEDELEFLRREVENIQEIRLALPPDNKCWKIQKLEP